MTEQWRINVDHLDVGAGDAALWCIYSNNVAAGEKYSIEKETLKKAVLIDGGGFMGTGYPDLIISILEKRLKDKNKKLDLIIVTHNDADHHMTIRLLFQDMKDNPDNSKNKLGPYIDINKTKFIDQGYDYKAGARKGPSSIIAENLVDLTSCGYRQIIARILGRELLWWEPEAIEIQYLDKKEALTDEGELKDERKIGVTSLKVIYVHTNDDEKSYSVYYHNDNVGDAKISKINLKGDITFGTDGLIIKEVQRKIRNEITVKKGKAYNISSLVKFEEDTIKEDTIKLKDNKSATVKQLRSANGTGTDAEKKPALFCIGIGGQILGSKQTSKPEKDDVNESSIALVLVSPEDEVLYYSAGDLTGPENGIEIAKPRNEQKVARWFKETAYDSYDPERRVLVHKLSHHGSKTSTPIELLQATKPKCAVLSQSGSGNGLPDIGVWLSIYYSLTLRYRKNFTPSESEVKKIANAASINFPTVLVGTGFPYYLATDLTFGSGIVKSAIEKERQQDLAIRLKKLTNQDTTLIEKEYSEFLKGIIEEDFKNLVYKTEFWERVDNFISASKGELKKIDNLIPLDGTIDAVEWKSVLSRYWTASGFPDLGVIEDRISPTVIKSSGLICKTFSLQKTDVRPGDGLGPWGLPDGLQSSVDLTRARVGATSTLQNFLDPNKAKEAADESAETATKAAAAAAVDANSAAETATANKHAAINPALTAFFDAVNGAVLNIKNDAQEASEAAKGASEAAKIAAEGAKIDNLLGWFAAAKVASEAADNARFWANIALAALSNAQGWNLAAAGNAKAVEDATRLIATHVKKTAAAYAVYATAQVPAKDAMTAAETADTTAQNLARSSTDDNIVFAAKAASEALTSLEKAKSAYNNAVAEKASRTRFASEIPSSSTHKPKKMKKKKLLPLFSALSLESSPIAGIAASNYSGTGNYQRLATNCDLDNFVQLLPGKALDLTAVQMTPAAQQMTLKGTVAGDLDDWFYNFDLSLSVELSGTIDGNNQFSVASEGAIFTLNTLSSALGAAASFRASLSADGLSFALNTFNLSPSLLTNMDFCHYIYGSSDAVANVLGVLAGAAGEDLTFPLSGALTEITFDPVDYSTRIELASELRSITLFDKIKLDPILLSFAASSRPIDDNFLRTSSSCYFNADLTIALSKNFETTIKGILYNDGAASFAISPGDENATLDFLDEFASLFYKNISIKEACATLGLTELNLLKHIVFDFNVLPTPTLKKVTVSSEMVWTIKEGVTLDLLLNFSLSDSLSIYGSLDVSTAPSGQALLAAHGIEPPETLSQSNSSVANLAFFDAQFSATPSSNFYSLDLSLGTEDQPLFKFNDEIEFQGLALSLSKTGDDVSASISAMVELARSNFFVMGQYNVDGSKNWIFSASIYLIPLSDITTLFIKEITGANISLPEIDLANLEVTFDLANKTFDFSGSLLLGSQTFNVSADTSQGTGGSHKLMSATWTANPNTPFGLSDLVAEFGKVMDLNLVLPKALSLNLQSAGLYYLMDKTTVGSVDTASHRVMGFELELASSALDLKGQFLLYAFEQAAAEPAPGADAGDETPATPAVGLESVVNIKATFPASLSLPLVGNVSLPIKSVEIFFVSQDLTEQKLGQINGVIPYINGENDENGKLWPLNLAGTNANSADGNAVVLTQGMHYQVNLSPSLAGLNLPMFDFNDAPAAAATSASLDTPTPASSSSTPSPIHWVKIDQGLGPIHLNRIGFGYQSGSILFSLDADLLLGGLTIGLDGLSMALPLNKLSDPSFSLNGLSLDYVLGDMELGGGFLKQIPPPSGELEHYAGEAVLKNEFLTLSAMGSYSKLSDDHISLFIFGMSQEPLGGPPAFYVTGFAGGFGYNQHLRLPSQDEVVNFPLVQGSSKPAVLNSGGSDLMSVLNTLEAGTNAWLTPQLNENWLAVGLDFSSFELIQSKALLVAQFGQDFELALLGRSWMQLPPEGEAIAYVEMGLEALFEPSQGFFGLTAVLSPNSFVFSRDCHLTGGFAFYLWFGGEHKGDFVVTLGGYHPNFVVPSHYPNEPRLGFNWQVSDDLVISGSAYFALTPSCVMGGGQLSADFSRGDLHAWFREYADFLIHWAPFEYEVDIGIDMGVSYRLNLLFTHVTLEVSLGADLTLWGPPLGGEAHVHWSVISFTVGFGQGRQEVKPMSWDEFQKKLPAAKNTSSSTTQGLSSKLLLSSGLLREEKEDNKPSVWVVRPDEFAFQTEALLPFTSFNFKVEEDEQKNTFSNQELWKDETTVDIRPMKLENLKLTHTLSITTKIPTQSSNSVSQMLSAAPPKAIDFWQVSVLDRKMPAALFGQPIDGAPSPSADCVDAYVGVELKPKTQQPGPNSGVLSLTALQQDGDRVQLSPADDEDNTNGYLNTAVEVLESLYQYGSDTNDEKEKKEQEQEARNLLASGLASDNSKEARFLLFRELKELGYLKSITDNGALSSMENLAKHASTRWSETPSFMQDSSSTQKLKLKKG